jgi:hypothetical protein
MCIVYALSSHRTVTPYFSGPITIKAQQLARLKELCFERSLKVTSKKAETILL